MSFFIRKLFQSIGLYIKGILNGWPATLCLVNSGNVNTNEKTNEKNEKTHLLLDLETLLFFQDFTLFYETFSFKMEGMPTTFQNKTFFFVCFICFWGACLPRRKRKRFIRVTSVQEYRAYKDTKEKYGIKYVQKQITQITPMGEKKILTYTKDH